MPKGIQDAGTRSVPSPLQEAKQAAMSTACMDKLSSAMQLLMAIDASSGKTYFIHVESKRTFWETPPGAVVVGRATTGGAASSAGSTSSRDHAKPSSTSAHGPVEGFAYKSDPKGKNWKQRWFMIDAAKHTAVRVINAQQSRNARWMG